MRHKVRYAALSLEVGNMVDIPMSFTRVESRQLNEGDKVFVIEEVIVSSEGEEWPGPRPVRGTVYKIKNGLPQRARKQPVGGDLLSIMCSATDCAYLAGNTGLFSEDGTLFAPWGAVFVVLHESQQ